MTPPNGPGKRASSKLTRGMDIFDVWFESGSSWHAVLEQRDIGFPADLYPRRLDQHRGWFQLAAPALGARWGYRRSRRSHARLHG
ncbi:MAG: class I tRNA ligase family protein [Thermodesulfobacteriota bacterium]